MKKATLNEFMLETISVSPATGLILLKVFESNRDALETLELSKEDRKLVSEHVHALQIICEYARKHQSVVISSLEKMINKEHE